MTAVEKWNTGSRILMTRIGLRVPGSVSYEDWERAGAGLARMADSSAWCLGDWVLFGRNRFPDRYRWAMETAGLDYQTIRNYVWVARRFEPRRRREGLSFGHHAEVAALPDEEQDLWMALAEYHQWSRNRLRTEIKGGRPSAALKPRETASLPRVVVDRDRLGQWQLAAERSGVALDEWVASQLDSAAAELLGPTGSGPRAAVGSGEAVRTD
ncbi:LmbU family transcriptional regulator [Kitasatospora sp. NPDC101183]|uniref:LmbU family transcriptional regulator n=1 Tax=Kitasatospora sp. NPDC101183 TaxID=3364100 RepID=UPI003816A68E